MTERPDRPAHAPGTPPSADSRPANPAAASSDSANPPAKRPAGSKSSVTQDVAVIQAARAKAAARKRSNCQQELEVLIRARYPLIYLVSWEEERVERI